MASAHRPDNADTLLRVVDGKTPSSKDSLDDAVNELSTAWTGTRARVEGALFGPRIEGGTYDL